MRLLYYAYKHAFPLLIILLLLSMWGCASRPPHEVEARYAVDRENWALCHIAYANEGRAIISYHDHKRLPHKPYEISADLRDNYCRAVLGEYWVHYD